MTSVKDDVSVATNKNELGAMVERLLVLTDTMLNAAEQGCWEQFEHYIHERDTVCDWLQHSAGDQLLVWLPDYRERLIAAQDSNQRIEALLAARRTVLMSESALSRQQDRLVQAYWR